MCTILASHSLVLHTFLGASPPLAKDSCKTLSNINESALEHQASIAILKSVF
jgi:hypothetical protein